MTLTERQRGIMEFIRQRIAAGLPPTIREIGAHFGIRTPNGVMCHLKALEARGLIVRDAKKARSIRLVEAAQ